MSQSLWEIKNSTSTSTIPDTFDWRFLFYNIRESHGSHFWVFIADCKVRNGDTVTKPDLLITSFLCQVPQSCPRVGWNRGSGRVGSGRVGSRFFRILAGRVESGRVRSLFFFSFLLIISWYLNRYESSNTTFGLIDFLRYSIYNN